MSERPDRPVDVPADWLGLWLAPGDKAVYIERAGAAYRVTVTPGVGARPFPANEVSGASAATDRLPAEWHTGARLPQWRVETEPETAGRLYLLNVAVANQEPDQWGGYQWRPASSTDPVGTVRLVPDAAAGFIDAVAWLDDEGYIPWAEPWVNYRKGTDEETRRFLAGLGWSDFP